MTPEELHRLFTMAGVACRVEGDEVVLKVCPYCGNDRWNMEVNVVNGFAKCWPCGEPRPGRADIVIALLTGERRIIPVRAGSKTHRTFARPAEAAPEFRSLPIESVLSARLYLERRGIDLGTAALYGLRVCVEPGHRLYGRIVIPAQDFWTGAVVGWVGRAYVGERPKYLSTLARARVTGWRWPGRRAPCAVVEGHLDGIAAHQAGCTAAVLGGTTGARLEEWAARLPTGTPVVVALDGSAVVEATRVFWKIAAVRDGARVALLRLAPDEDPASVGPVRLRGLVADALNGG